MHSEDVAYAAEELKKLIGWQIVDTVVSGDNESYGFIVERTPHGKKVCWVDRDPEGNGPGWLQVEDISHEQDDATSG